LWHIEKGMRLIMNVLDALNSLCQSYKKQEFGLEEFQNRIETIVIPDKEVRKLEKILLAATNELERIRFTSLEENYFSKGSEVADRLLNQLEEYKNSLQNTD